AVPRVNHSESNAQPNLPTRISNRPAARDMPASRAPTYDVIQTQIATAFFYQIFSKDGQWTLASLLRHTLLLDMYDTRADITDSAADKQIDALIVDDDKFMVRIVQGKFIQSGTVDAEPLREVLSAWLQIKDLARLQNVANQKLARKLRELADALEE